MDPHRTRTVVGAMLAGVVVPCCLGLTTACLSVLGVEDLPRHRAELAPDVDAGLDATTEVATPTPIVYVEPGCAVCVAEQCFAEETVCRPDFACSAAYACVAACPIDDAVCRTTCEGKHTSAVGDGTLYDVLELCRRGACQATCHGQRGLLATIETASCSACVDVRCPAVEAACIGALGCERAFGCASEVQPLNPDRALECAYRLTTGAQLDPLQACYEGCDDTCLFGSDFRCVGKFSWARGVGGIDHVVNFSKVPNLDQPAPGLTVTACDFNDCRDCLVPLASGVTDQSGAVKLHLPVNGLGFRGCFRISGPGYPQAIYYPGRPITRVEGRFHISLPDSTLLGLIGTLTGKTLDPARGHVGIDIWDCLMDHAKNVSLEVIGADGSSFPYYVKGGAVDFKGTRTDRSGSGGVLDVPPGDVTVIARDATTGVELGRTVALVIAGGVTAVSVFPAALP